MKNKTWLWHLRFGNLHYEGLNELEKKKMIHGLHNMEYINKYFEGFVLGRQVRTNFEKKIEYRARRSLDMVHTNICDPMFQSLLVRKGILLFSLMIIQGRLKFTF